MGQKTIFPSICIALGFPDVESLLAHAKAEYDCGERFLEFRLDYLASPGTGRRRAAQVPDAYPDCMILATCRRRQNQGRFTGSIEEQIRSWRPRARPEPRLWISKSRARKTARTSLAHLRSEAYLVLSYHNYGGTPPRLDSVSEAHGCDSGARLQGRHHGTKTFRQFAGAVLGAIASQVPTVLLAMGETGFPTRVLSPAFGGLYTYAAPNMAGGTASGQVGAKKLRGCIAWENSRATPRSTE